MEGKGPFKSGRRGERGTKKTGGIWWSELRAEKARTQRLKDKKKLHYDWSSVDQSLTMGVMLARPSLILVLLLLLLFGEKLISGAVGDTLPRIFPH